MVHVLMVYIYLQVCILEALQMGMIEGEAREMVRQEGVGVGGVGEDGGEGVGGMLELMRPQ